MVFRAAGPLRDLAPNAAEPVDGVVRLGQLVPDIDREVELLLEVLGGRGHPGILDQLEALRLRVVADGQAHPVRSRRGQRA